MRINVSLVARSGAGSQAADDNPVLRVWSSAKRSAAHSSYVRPAEVYQALDAIADIGKMYLAQQKSKQSLGNLDALFSDRGFKYTPTDSQTTTTKYGRDRTFSEGDRKKRFDRHITLGGGDRQNCLKVGASLGGR